MTKKEITAFVGWCCVLNVTLLLISSAALLFEPSWIRSVFALAYTTGDMRALHSEILHIDQQEIGMFYVNVLTQYKLLIVVFNVVPYCALKLMRKT
ncbi:DUF6868 family protein [Labrenzia sp. PHM005]|uniref:DUF6868 family protein n=1 Tax=Labrenzia sp. PHM005 TaxID=2590016 RepID=UPI00113FE0B3|nr:hypothetical protein [Labrenzia sp. PHM005]QDG76547.1 hypothetical protein FJ695_12060 [Labrenzia sp. PHM005]